MYIGVFNSSPNVKSPNLDLDIGGMAEGGKCLIACISEISEDSAFRHSAKSRFLAVVPTFSRVILLLLGSSPDWLSGLPPRAVLSSFPRDFIPPSPFPPQGLRISLQRLSVAKGVHSATCYPPCGAGREGALGEGLLPMNSFCYAQRPCAKGRQPLNFPSICRKLENSIFRHSPAPHPHLP